MSYEPMILIEYKDFLDNKKKILRDSCSDEFEVGGGEQITVPEYLLRHCQEQYTVILKGNKFFMFKPEFSSFNAEVTEYLTAIGIKYGVSD